MRGASDRISPFEPPGARLPHEGKRKCSNPSSEHVPRHIHDRVNRRPADVAVDVERIDPPALDVDIRDFRGLSECWDSEVFIDWPKAPNADLCAEYVRHTRTTQEVQKITTTRMRNCSVPEAWECVVHMKKSGVPVNVEIYTALISRCVKHGAIQMALTVLKDMRRDGVLPDAITYHVLTMGCKKHAMAAELQALFADMRRDGIARNAAVCLLYRRDEEKGRNVQQFTAKNLYRATWPETTACIKEMQDVGLEPNGWVRTAALPNYPFDRLICSPPPDVLSELQGLGLLRDLTDLGQLIATCEMVGLPQLACELLHAATGTPNILKRGLGDDRGTRTVDFRPEKLQTRSTGRYNARAFQVTVALFNYHVSQQAIDSGTRFYVGRDANVEAAVAHCMRKHGMAPVAGVELDGTRNPEWLECGRASFARCLHGGQIDLALDILQEMGERGFYPEGVACSELVHACMKTGRIHDAGEVFQKLFNSEFEPKIAICNAAIEACGQQGYNHEAVQIFERMLERKVSPDARSYFAAIAACQRQGGELMGKIDPLIDAAVVDGTFHPALGYYEAEEASLLEFSASAIAAKKEDAAPPYAVSQYFVQAMFMYHHARGHIEPRKTRLAPDSDEARGAIQKAMMKLGLYAEYKHMLDEYPLT